MLYLVNSDCSINNVGNWIIFMTLISVFCD